MKHTTSARGGSCEGQLSDARWRAASRSETPDKMDNEPTTFAHTVVFGLLLLVCFIEGADQQLLPSTFRALEADLGLNPSDLATLGMCQALAQCATAPLWGILLDCGYSGKWMLVAGSAGWGLLTLLLARITDFYSMLALRTLNGVALATLTPVSQAIIASLTLPRERGTYFGWCGCFMILGGVFCTLVTTSISNETVWGYAGWRVAFVFVAILSFILSGLLAVCMRDAGRQTLRPLDMSHELQTFLGYCRIKSFMVIVLQGCFGSIPWSALGFLIMYFQYVKVTDRESAVLYSSMMLALASGNVLGGHIADKLAAWNRYHGRPLTAQISVGAGIPMILLLLWEVPQDSPNTLYYGLLLCIFGLTASWCGVGVNRPILTEVVPESSQARVIAWLTALEGSSAACLGGPLVGLLADEVFGYEAQRSQVSDIPEDIRLRNANALASGMLWMTILPWTACFVIYTTLHMTLKGDIDKMSGYGEGSRLIA